MIQNIDELLAFLEDRKQLGIKPGLERMHAMLRYIGNPEKKIRAIHVAGTNGKGSTINFIKYALMANNYNVGVFTSPSLEGITGHILHNGEKISEEHIIESFQVVYPAIVQLDQEHNAPTEFEIITVMAFVYFAKYVDIALIETGMGGRDDTTNCFHPLLSIITNVELDHTAFLGETIHDIAIHKAGIIKEKTPVIIGEMKEEALTVMNETAKAKQAILYQCEKDFLYSNISVKEHIQHYQWSFKSIQKDIEIALLGKHQVKNSAIAVMALYVLSENHFPIDWESALEGIKTATIFGRFERINKNPTIVLDGAHNPAGIKSFLQTVESQVTSNENHLLFAVFKDKDMKQMLNLLQPHFKTITICTFNHPRAATYKDIMASLHEENVFYANHWQDEIVKMKQIGNESKNYFITGSIHFISIVRDYLIKNC